MARRSAALAWLAVGCAAACGRVGFTPLGDAIGDTTGDAAAPLDAPVDAAVRAVVQHAYLKASNTDAGDQFGWTTAVSGDGSTIAVGSFIEGSRATGVGGNQTDNTGPQAGAVYVFARAGTTWTQQAYVKASNTDPGNHFGVAVALSGDGSTLVVGANQEASSAAGVGGNQADNSLPSAGAAYVFTRAGTTWTQDAYLKASNPGAADHFGEAVAVSADGATIAVGASREDSSATDSGAVYVFARAGAGWGQQAYIKASNPDAADQFGATVGLSADGSTLLVTAQKEDGGAAGVNGDATSNTAADSGAAYVFTRSGATWAQAAYVKASNPDPNDQFGFASAVSGDGATIAIGAPNEASASAGIDGAQGDNSLLFSGAVYVFARTGAVWAQQAYVKAGNPGHDDNFGFSVSLTGDGSALVVGSILESGTGDALPASGAAYLLVRGGTTWTQAEYLKSSNTGSGDNFGHAVSFAADGSTLAVSAHFEASAATGIDGDGSDDSAGSAGAVYVFE